MTDKQWQGKTGGGRFGQSFLFWFLRNVRVSFLYPVLYVVIPFYCLFGKKGRQAMMIYFKNHHQYSAWHAFIAMLKNHIVFGKVVLDKFAVLAGNTKQFSVVVEHEDLFLEAISQPQGFFVVSAHVGNFEMAGHCIRQDKKNMNAIVYGGESKMMQERRSSAFQKSHLNLILVAADMSHLFAIKEAIDKGEIVTIPCDRLFGSPKSYAADLLGKTAQFPIGTFRFAAQLNAPVLAIFIMKEKGLQYRGFVFKLQPLEDEKASMKKAEYLGKQYVSILESLLKKYPEQWFNYYDFWNEIYEQ